MSSFVRVNETFVLLSRSQQEPALKQHACSAACASTTKTTRLRNNFSNWAPSGRTNEHHTCNNGGSDHNHRNRCQARDASSSACSRARTPIERCRCVPTSFWAPFPHRETRVPTASSLLCRRSCALVRTHAGRVETEVSVDTHRFVQIREVEIVRICASGVLPAAAFVG